MTPEMMDALRFAHERITAYHEKQVPEDAYFTDLLGVELRWRWTTLESVGLYVLGWHGKLSKFDSDECCSGKGCRCGAACHGCALARRQNQSSGAGGGLILPGDSIRSIVLVLHRLLRSCPMARKQFGMWLVKIVGPGNAYVSAAKQQIFVTVGIDMIDGPSEILVIADEENDPDWIAADLLTQAEHDSAAQSILITDSARFAAAVQKAVEVQHLTLPRFRTVSASWRDFGALLLVDDLKKALPLANRIAPEYLEVSLREPEALLAGVRNAAAVFLGRYTPEVIDDYVGGSNHVLPTARSARFSSFCSGLYETHFPFETRGRTVAQAWACGDTAGAGGRAGSAWPFSCYAA